MMRTWRLLGLQTLLAAAVAATPSPAVPPFDGPPPPEQVAKAGEDKEKNATEVLQSQLKELKEELSKLIGEVRNHNLASDRALNAAKDDIKDLKDQIARLRQDLEDLRRAGPATRVSGYGEAGTATGRLRLVNTYFEPQTVILNNKASYRLAPGETKLTDPLPVGDFTYEVLGVQAPRTRPLTANEVFTIRIYPTY